MPFRFRKSLKIFPGLKINLSKGGISTSVGGRGASLNIGKRGLRSTVGIPGSGLSYSASTSNKTSHSNRVSSNGLGCITFPFVLLWGIIKVLFTFLVKLLQGATKLTTWAWNQATSTRERKVITASIIGVALTMICTFTLISSTLNAFGLLSTPDTNAISTSIASTLIASFSQTAIAIPTATLTPSPPATLTPAPITLEAIVYGLKNAGLEAENPTLLSKSDYGLAPYVCKGAHFFIPSVCSDCGGRIFVCPNQDDLNALQSYYRDLGRQSAALYSWVFSKNNVLIQINGDMQESVARNYETVLNSIVK